MESGKTTTALVWAGIVVAGAVALVAIAKRPHKSLSEMARTPLRDVQEVLTDCYTKVREIEENLPNVVPNRPNRAGRHITSNNPVLES